MSNYTLRAFGYFSIFIKSISPPLLKGFPIHGLKISISYWETLILLHSDGLNFPGIFLWLKSSLMFMYTSQKKNICFLKSHSKTNKNDVGLGMRESLSNLLTTNVPFI